MLTELNRQETSAIYSLDDGTESPINRYILTTPETRAICNNPFVLGLDYTNKLEEACATFLRLAKPSTTINLEETRSVVFNILRGGLNFGLRGALAKAYGWNNHSSSFVTAQRKRLPEDSEQWHITEDDYKKVSFPQRAQIIIGDVVATGTSLRHGLEIMIDEAVKQNIQLGSIVFFTIGGEISEARLIEADTACRKHFPDYEGTHLCYIEGRFFVPTIDTRVSVKLTGTDLIRCGALMTPEFIESNYESATYPLERCTIYDAGSRAFQVKEYTDDVIHYWNQVLELSTKISFTEMLTERFPELDPSKFGDVSLTELAKDHLHRLKLIKC
ncbi:MAG: hypothetical protein OCC45_04895 [Desulfotalea sp.]